MTDMAMNVLQKVRTHLEPRKLVAIFTEVRVVDARFRMYGLLLDRHKNKTFFYVTIE